SGKTVQQGCLWCKLSTVEMRDTPAGVGGQKIGAIWIGGGPYTDTGLKTAAASLACAQPARPCDPHGARHFHPSKLGSSRFVARRRGRGSGIWQTGARAGGPRAIFFP